jgi:hypothetical protein
MRPDLINNSGLDEYIRSSNDEILKNKFKYLEDHKDQLILFFEHTGNKNDGIIEILHNESFYKSIIKKEFEGVSAWTPIDAMAPVVRLVELAYNDFKELEFESKKDYN